MTELIQSLIYETGFRESDVIALMIDAPVRYKSYRIEKRAGGYREIAQPAVEIKTLQSALVRVLLNQLPVHKCATAYKVGSSIKNNADIHKGYGALLKMDLKNFFPSIRSQDWVSYCRRTGCLTNDEDIRLTSHLLFRKQPNTRLLRLAIGAPSSPVLSNILMFQFDVILSEKIATDKVQYSRYADDMAFSATRLGFLNRVIKNVAATIREIQYPKLEIKKEKTKLVTPKYHRTVTGLTLANDGRVTIGREKKRIIRATIHHALNGKLSPEQLLRLSGMLAFVHSVEPKYSDELQDKYGRDVIGRLRSLGARRRDEAAFESGPLARKSFV